MVLVVSVRTVIQDSILFDVLCEKSTIDRYGVVIMCVFFFSVCFFWRGRGWEDKKGCRFVLFASFTVHDRYSTVFSLSP